MGVGTIAFYGLSFINGNVSSSGGAVYSYGSVVAQYCDFANNSVAGTSQSGGGLYAYRAALSNCNFENNSTGALGSGGGVRTYDNLVMTNCTFINNNAVYGGGASSNATATIAGCSFIANTATIYGGGVCVNNSSTLTDCIFINNQSSNNGGGLYIGGAATAAVLTGCTFAGNEALNNGGGIYINSNITLSKCTFTGNGADSYGGGLYASDTATLNNCNFIGNYSNISGGGIYTKNATVNRCVFVGNTSNATGSAVYNATLLIMTNCTISENTIDLTTQNGAIRGGTSSYIYHCTVTNNAGGGIKTDNGSSIYLYNSILAGNTNEVDGTPLQYVIGTGTNNFTTGRNMIEGQPIPGTSPSLNATYRQIFGLNEFDAVKNTQNVLGNGIAKGTAAAITSTDLTNSALSSIYHTQVLSNLNTDQNNRNRVPSNGKVTYGAVEAGANTLQSIAASLINSNPTKTPPPSAFGT